MRRVFTAIASLLMLALVTVTLPARAEDAPADLVSPTRILNAKGLSKAVTPQQAGLLEQADRWALFKLEVELDKKAYKIGDLMHITVKSSRDCYILVYYIAADGSAAVICPSPFSTNNRVKAGVPFKLVDNTGKLLKQSGPVGVEQLQVVACDRPFDLSRLQGLAATPAALAAMTPPPQKPVAKPTTAPKKPAQATRPPAKTPSRPAYRPAPPPTYRPPAKPSRPPAMAAAPFRVNDRDLFAKSVEIGMRDHILDTAKVVAERYPKGITPQVKVDKAFSCFSIDSVKYDVTQ